MKKVAEQVVKRSIWLMITVMMGSGMPHRGVTNPIMSKHSINDCSHGIPRSSLMPSACKQYYPPSEGMNQHMEKSSLDRRTSHGEEGEWANSAWKEQGGGEGECRLLAAQRKPQLEDWVST